MIILYISNIRTVNKSRSHFTTTLSKSLLDQIKEIADRKNSSYNYLLEEGMNWVYETYYLKGSFSLPPKPVDRIKINTTFNTSLFNKIKSRAKRLGKNIHANDLIEEGMKYIIGLEQDLF
ncbi:hypothetical protein MOE90_20525 [Bacillus spizizenii]|nr:hypothetical protein [Bacillus spizizenii]MCY9124918.1 hypothetical protein [Bacillus spizizenii]